VHWSKSTSKEIWNLMSAREFLLYKFAPFTAGSFGRAVWPNYSSTYGFILSWRLLFITFWFFEAEKISLFLKWGGSGSTPRRKMNWKNRSRVSSLLSSGWVMEVNSDGDVAEQIFYDTVREYVVSVSFSVSLCFVKMLGTNDRTRSNEKLINKDIPNRV